jgi:BolA family transcriptional regulator, general stress-responsive regulator
VSAAVEQTLRARLAPLSPTVVEIHDDSREHAGHAGAAGGGGHFSLVVVSEAFSGQSRLARHRAVLERVGDLIPNPVHALAIQAYAPEEFPSQPPKDLQ